MNDLYFSSFSIHSGGDDKEYRNYDGLSQSALKEFLRSPAHYQAYKSQPKESTKAMQVGTAFHALCLQDDPAKHFAVKKKVDGRTKDGAKYNAEFEAEHQGKAIITEEDNEMIVGMRDSLLLHPIARGFVEQATYRELAMYATIDGLHMPVTIKGLADGYCQSSGAFFDLKSCEDASPRGFRSAIFERGYDIQDCHYTALGRANGFDVFGFYFIAVEKKPPYAIAIYNIAPESRQKTQERWLTGIKDFAWCTANNVWQGYDITIKSITL